MVMGVPEYLQTGGKKADEIAGRVMEAIRTSGMGR